MISPLKKNKKKNNNTEIVTHIVILTAFINLNCLTRLCNLF